MNRIRHIFRLIGLAVMLHLTLAVASAASLENIEVNSRLGEPFFAEIPLQLESNELVSKVFVEIAAASDYKIFEVYRDPELNAIRADVESDARGVRVKLSSRTAVKAPFFNLIVKIRHGRVAHFKKYPVFLEAPKTVVQAAEKAPVPTVHEVASIDTPPKPAAIDNQPSEEMQYFSGWARTDRYGPIVRGDALSTVAERLRVDKRYTNYQVMVALFEKNRSKFDQQNMNLLLKDSYLKVPTADEVESASSREAYKVFSQHEKQWKELNQQPRYAAEAEAQRTRYSKRVRMGDQADGVAAAPIAAEEVASASDSDGAAPIQDGSDDGVSEQDVPVALDEAANQQQSAETTALLEELKKQNELLEQKLEQSEQAMVALNQKVDEAASAASEANVKRLEVLVARMQGELEKARAEAAAKPVASGMDWVVWLLIALVVVLLIVVALLMRREPAHPADAQLESDVEMESARESVQADAVAASAEESAVLESPEEKEESVVASEDSPVVEQKSVAEIETAEGKSDLFDSIDSFPDDLTDTDTAEMVPYDASAMDEPDPSIDYLSEAEVYIRYGMEEEALQQLDLALRLKPDHVDAHVRKVELLHARNEAERFNLARVAAQAALSGAGLEQFNSAASAYVDMVDDSISLSSASTDPADVVEPVAGEISQDEEPALDFDFSEQAGTATEVAQDGVESTGHESDQATDINDFGEMDWLHDAAFEDEVESEPEQDVGGETIALSAEDGATQVIDSILDDFETEESRDISLSGEEIDTEQKVDLLPDAEGTLDLAAIGATQELDNLLNAFSEEDETKAPSADEIESEPSLEAADDVPVADTAIDLEKEVTATQHLDNLLGEFSDDDSMFEGEEELISATSEFSESPLKEKESEEEEVFGATQHLDVLMSEFAGNEEETLSGLDIERTDQESPEEVLSDSAEDPGATQQLDHLLGEFSAMNESSGQVSDDEFEGLSFDKVDHLSEEADEIEVDHCATQELDHLLSEFSDDEDEDEKNS